MIRKKVSKILISAGVVASVIGISPVILSHAQTLNNEHNYKIDSSNSSIQKAVVNTTVKLSNGTANKYDMAVITGENGNNYNIITQYGVTGSIPKSYLTIVKSGTGNKLIKLNETEHVIHVTTVLNVREQPDVHSGLLTTLKEDTNIEVTGQEGEWLQVNINGQIGYVYNDFVGQGTIGNVTSAQATNNIINQEIQQQGKKAYKEALNNIKTINNYENNEANIQNENTNTKTNIITNTTRPYQTTITYSTPKNGYVNITNGYLNLRNGAGLENPVIDHLLKNEKIEVLAKNGNWYEISVNNKTGWVYSKYITLGNINSPIKNTSFQNPQVNTPHKYEPKQSSPNNKTNVKPVVPEHHQDVKPSVKPEQPQQPTKPTVKPIQQQVTKTVLEVETLCNGKEVKGATYCILGTGKYEGQNFTTNGKEMVLTLDSADVTGANLTILPNGYGFVNYTTNKVVSVKDGVRTIKVVTELKVDKANEPQHHQDVKPEQPTKPVVPQHHEDVQPQHHEDVKPSVKPEQPQHHEDVKPSVKPEQPQHHEDVKPSVKPEQPQHHQDVKPSVKPEQPAQQGGQSQPAPVVKPSVKPEQAQPIPVHHQDVKPSVKPVVPEHHQNVKPSVKPEQSQSGHSKPAPEHHETVKPQPAPVHHETVKPQPAPVVKPEHQVKPQQSKPVVKPQEQEPQQTKPVVPEHHQDVKPVQPEHHQDVKPVKPVTQYGTINIIMKDTQGIQIGQEETARGVVGSADTLSMPSIPAGYQEVSITVNGQTVNSLPSKFEAGTQSVVITVKATTAPVRVEVVCNGTPINTINHTMSVGSQLTNDLIPQGLTDHYNIKSIDVDGQATGTSINGTVQEGQNTIVINVAKKFVQQGMAINSQEFNQIFANEVCSEVNAIRAQHGKTALQETSLDNQAASYKAQDMDKTGLTHVCSNGKTLNEIYGQDSAGAGMSANLGGLVCKGSTGTAAYAKQLAKEAVNLWMSSAAHAAAILTSGIEYQGASIHYYVNSEGTPCVWVVWTNSGVNTSQINWN